MNLRIILHGVCFLIVLVCCLSIEMNNPALACAVIQGQEPNKVVARKFDDFELIGVYYDDMKALLDRFYYEGLMKEPNSRAYAIFYRGRHSSSRYYPLQVRNWLVDTRGFPANRVKAIYGGYREVAMLELWVVPEGAADPRATPTVFLKKRRKR
jgi:hypothetical protein